MPLKFEAEVGLNAAGFHRGMESITSTLKSYALGAIGVYTVERAFDKTLETVKELVNESKRMGITVEQVQVLKKASEEAGIEVGVLGKAMEKLNEFRAKALGGGAESANALRTGRQLGISRDMLLNQNAQDIIFGAIRQKILSVNPQQIADPLKQVLGRGFGEAIPVITKDLGELQKRMEKFGMIISGKTAFELEAFEKATHSAQNILISGLAPTLVTFGEGLIAVTGILAGFFAAIGAGTDRWSWKDWLKAILVPPLALLTNPKFDRHAAGKAFNEAEGPWKELLKQLRDDALRDANLKPPNFLGEVNAQAPLGHGRTPEDSLIRVGNFLGSSRGVINNAQARLEQHAANTATNTKMTVEKIQQMLDVLNRKLGVQSGGTNWPS